MEFPLTIHLFTWELNVHGIFEGLAHLVGVITFWKIRSNSPDVYGASQRWRLIFFAGVGALVGSKIVGVFDVLHQSGSFAELTFPQIFRSKTIVGGLLGGLFAVESYKKLNGLTQSSGDMFVFPLLLAIIIGRMGCFSAGVFDGTHGKKSSLPWAMDMGDGVLRHPTQMYEITFLIILSFALYTVRAKAVHGSLFKIFMTSYLSFRLLIEFIKPVDTFFLVFSSIQWACILGLIYYLIIFILPLHKNRGKP